jgi:hypothetical protein
MTSSPSHFIESPQTDENLPPSVVVGKAEPSPFLVAKVNISATNHDFS